MPSLLPTAQPSQVPSLPPSQLPSILPTSVPSQVPTLVPSQVPTLPPSQVPTPKPTAPITVERAKVLGLLIIFGLVLAGLMVLGRLKILTQCALRAWGRMQARLKVGTECRKGKQCNANEIMIFLLRELLEFHFLFLSGTWVGLMLSLWRFLASCLQMNHLSFLVFLMSLFFLEYWPQPQQATREANLSAATQAEIDAAAAAFALALSKQKALEAKQHEVCGFDKTN